MALKVVRAIGGLAVALSLAWLIGAVSEHDAERGRWEELRTMVGSPEYDARASDQAYARSRTAHRNAGWSALLLALGVCVVLIGRPPNASQPVSTLRRNLASGVDLLLVGSLFALVMLDDAESALLHAVVWSAPVLALAAHALPLHRLGRTAGMALVGARDEVGIGRSLLASIALPLAIVGLLRPSWSAPHWRLAGVARGPDAE